MPEIFVFKDARHISGSIKIAANPQRLFKEG
jgi:hypothetical protein